MSQLDPEFGVNGAQVRIFLGELRRLDLDRAIEVWNAYSVAQERGYAAAFEAAESLAAKQRTDAWLLARQAAAAVARERLGDPAVVGEIVDVLASVAGSIVIRDLLSRHDFKLLQLPWMWEGESTGLPLAAAAAAGVVATAPATKAPWLLGGSAAVPAVAGVAAVAVIAGALLFLGRPTSRVSVVEPTDAGRTTVVATSSAFEPSPVESAAPSLAASPEETADETTAPAATSRPGSPGAPPPPAPTSAPPTHAPTSTPKPTQKPPPPPPTPAPTPTPPTVCVVVNLLDLNTVKAQEMWSKAGFTGTVTFSPAVPPQYKIVWQSLTAGLSVACDRDITVSNKAP